ncbi:MAG: phosphoribosyltransferase [Saprospiraceae bacterium]|nr:phosphoribosyltransferase [Candidatus Vicinibacter affinis]MBK7305220.1 phosphoribosyltransferase [Candidatus Vicinibacter affinis]MBK8403589.1 phosphoribosyltransferase [Candidatus Vicinibacter affinis]MBK9643030.1 phosphoribosyltransferase [Candidatus Vicinibacter affinis]
MNHNCSLQRIFEQLCQGTLSAQNSMIILNKQQIEKKIRRMAMEVYERHADQKSIILAGVNQKGYFLAKLLQKELKHLCNLTVTLANLKINAADPLHGDPVINIDDNLIGKSVCIIVDDVSNSGRTIFFGFKAFMSNIPKKVEVCVLVERMHKQFPISVDYFGLRLATTIKQNIEVKFEEECATLVEMY